MEKTNITIQNPCNANWNNMAPDDNGKYCGSCKKTVVDFTTMDIEQIKHFLGNKKNEKVCGHFNNTQVIVSRPKHHQLLVDLYLKIENNFRTPIFKTLTLSLIVLCMTVVGCNRPTTGEVVASHDVDTMSAYIDTTNTPNTLMGDTILNVQTDTNKLISGEICIKPKKK